MNWSLGLLAITSAVFVWMRWRFRISKQWAKRFTAAIKAERAGDLNAAEASLAEADVFARRKGGLLQRSRLSLTKAPLARILYKRGQLERSAALTFDVLQELLCST